MRHFHHWIRSSNYFSNSRFYCIEKRIIFINGYETLSLSGIDEIMTVSIKSNFLSQEGRRPNVRRPNGRAPKWRRPNGGTQTAAPKRPAPQEREDTFPFTTKSTHGLRPILDIIN